MSVTYYARGASSTANNTVINSQNTNTTPVTELVFDQPVLSGGTTGTFYVNGVQHTYEIEFYGTLPNDTKQYPNLFTQEIVVVRDTTTGQLYFFPTDPNYATVSNMSAFPNGQTTLENVTVPCFVRGTVIATANGPKPVEAIVPGDLVLTDAGPLPVAWVGARVVTAQELSHDPGLAPIRFAPGSMGENRPSTPLSLSPDHRVVIAGAEVELTLGSSRAFCAAKFLVGRPGIVQEAPGEAVEYFHILLSSHRILTANGLECESLSHGPRALEALGPDLCGRLMAEGALKAGETRSPLPVLKRFEATALS